MMIFEICVSVMGSRSAAYVEHVSRIKGDRNYPRLLHRNPAGVMPTAHSAYVVHHMIGRFTLRLSAFANDLLIISSVL